MGKTTTTTIHERWNKEKDIVVGSPLLWVITLTLVLNMFRSRTKAKPTFGGIDHRRRFVSVTNTLSPCTGPQFVKYNT